MSSVFKRLQQPTMWGNSTTKKRLEDLQQEIDDLKKSMKKKWKKHRHECAVLLHSKNVALEHILHTKGNTPLSSEIQAHTTYNVSRDVFNIDTRISS